MAAHGNPNIVTDGLVLCLDAGDKNSYPGSGTTWTDLSGNGYYGTLSTAAIGTDNPGYMAFTSGSDEYITMSTTSLIGTDTTFAIEAWFSSTRTGNEQIYGEDYTTTAYVRNHFGRVSSGKMAFDQWPPSGGNIESTTVIQADTWYSVTYTQNGSNRYFYINGELENSDSSAETYGGNTPNVSYIGARGAVPGYGGTSNSRYKYFDGLIGMFRIYNRTLLASEIKQNFEAHRIRFGV